MCIGVTVYQVLQTDRRGALPVHAGNPMGLSAVVCVPEGVGSDKPSYEELGEGIGLFRPTVAE